MPRRFRNRAVRGVFVVRGHHELDSRFGLRNIYIATRPGARSAMERGEDARHDKTAALPRRSMGPTVPRARDRAIRFDASRPT